MGDLGLTVIFTTFKTPNEGIRVFIPPVEFKRFRLFTKTCYVVHFPLICHLYVYQTILINFIDANIMRVIKARKLAVLLVHL